ncbi:glycosyltransferase family 4 protein [Chloroflexota bacterium]
MKVALVSYFYPNVIFGGSAFYASNLADALSKYAEVTVIVPNVNPEILKALNSQARHEKVRFLKLPFLRSPSFLLLASLRSSRKNFDIVHSNGGDGALCRFVSVETFHHMPDEFSGKIHSLPSRIALRRAAHIIAVSQKSRLELLNMGISEDKITIVENGVDIDKFCFQPYNAQELKRSLGLPDCKLVLNINTELSRRKNLPLMLKSLQYLKEAYPGVKLVLIGPVAGRESVMQTFQKENLEKDLLYVSAVPPSLMPQYYRAADFLAMPSFKEGFGFPLLESIAVGTPFVSMDVGIAPILSRQCFGRIASSEEDFIKECIGILNNPLEFGDRGSTLVQEQFSWDACARKTMAVYEKARAPKGTGQAGDSKNSQEKDL